MLFFKARNVSKRGRILMLILGSLALNGCSSMNISYVPRDELKKASFTTERPRYIGKAPLELGALRLRTKDASTEDQGDIFILKRKSGVYMAETKVMDTGKKRIFFSVGIDYRNKTPAVGLKMEF